MPFLNFKSSLLLVLFAFGFLDFAYSSPLCAKQLMNPVLEITEKDIEDVQGILDRSRELHPIEALDVYTQWMDMRKTRPDLVVAGAIKILDAAQSGKIEEAEAAGVLAKRLDTLVEVLPHGDDYAYVLEALPSFFERTLNGNEYSDAVTAFLRIRTKSLAPYKRILLEKMESSLLALGYQKEFYKELGVNANPAALKWDQLRMELKSKVADRGATFKDLERYLEATTFSTQMSAYLKLLSERQSLTELFKVFELDPLEVTVVPALMQQHIFSLARLPKPKEALERDFATSLALKNINLAFQAKIDSAPITGADDALIILETALRNSSIGKHKTNVFFKGLEQAYHSFIHLSFVWEKIILLNLEGKTKHAVPEAKLLEEAVDVPEFIFRFVYQNTESPRMRSFLSRLEQRRLR